MVAGGGGSIAQEALVLMRFAKFVPPDATVLVIPWARWDPADPGVLSWIFSTFRQLGLSRVRPVTAVGPINAELQEAGAAFLCGGNTFLLLDRLRSSRAVSPLLTRVRAGMPCYGGSAGAIVLGSHVGTAAHLDRNEVGVTDLAGLDLFHGHALWCHFSDADIPTLRAYREDHGVPVIAIPENAGVTHDSTGIVAIGPGRITRWRGDADEPL